eukprot:352983-Hanusia_phi.AAC.1
MGDSQKDRSHQDVSEQARGWRLLRWSKSGGRGQGKGEGGSVTGGSWMERWGSRRKEEPWRGGDDDTGDEAEGQAPVQSSPSQPQAPDCGDVTCKRFARLESLRCW